jgi:hypothetical protein
MRGECPRNSRLLCRSCFSLRLKEITIGYDFSARGCLRNHRVIARLTRTVFAPTKALPQTMNYNLESGVPSAYTENTITCITCGKPFAFSQTVEGRCLRDHIAYMENERRQLMAASRGGGGGGGGSPSNIVVQGPTINMSNQQSTNVTAIAQAGGLYGRPRVGCFRRWRKRFYCVICLLLLAGAAYGIAMAIMHGKGGSAAGGGTRVMSPSSSSTIRTAVVSTIPPIAGGGSSDSATQAQQPSIGPTLTTPHAGFPRWRTTTTAPPPPTTTKRDSAITKE